MPQHKNQKRAPVHRGGNAKHRGKGAQNEKDLKSWALQVKHSATIIHKLIASAEEDVELKFVTKFSLESATQQFFAYVLRTNAAYDVDPLGASTATAGFAEQALKYYYYRVAMYDAKVEFANTSINPCQVIVGHTNTDCGISPGGSAVDLFSLCGNDYFEDKQLAHAYAKSSWTDNRSLSISQVVGSNAPETEDNYRSAVTTVPVDLTYLVIGVNSFVSPVSMPVDVTVHLTMWTRFYDRKPLSA